MQRWKNLVWLSAGVLALGVIITAVAPGAIAQSRATILVRDMDSAIRGTRFTTAVGVVFEIGSDGDVGTITPTIPAGKKLFIQRVTTNGLLSDNQAFTLVVLDFSAGGRFVVAQVLQATRESSNYYAGNQDIDVLMNPGESIQLTVTRNGTRGSDQENGLNANLIGYLVDANP